MKNITVKASLVRAAMAVQAVKDVRYYLNGFLLSTAGKIVGTDGHSLFVADYNEGGECAIVDRDVIVRIYGTIPVTAKTVAFQIPDAKERPRGVCTTDNDKAFAFELIDGVYPKYERVIPPIDRRTFSSGFAIDSAYLAKIEKVFGKRALVQIRIGLKTECIVVTRESGDPEADPNADGRLIIMPCRTNTEFLKATVPSEGTPNENHTQRPGIQSDIAGIQPAPAAHGTGSVPACH